MQKVMQALERYNLYFLDSVTIGNTQAMRAAQGNGVKVIKRKVFLDDSQNEAYIRMQFNREMCIRDSADGARKAMMAHLSFVHTTMKRFDEDQARHARILSLIHI